MIRTTLPHIWTPSPNFEPRRDGKRADMLILHYTGMTEAGAACDWLCNAESGVSCHYLIDEAGGIFQMVDEAARAWHAGVSCWKGETDVNSRSIGIEIHNPGHTGGYPDFPEAQMVAAIALCREIVTRHAIAPERVLAHSDVAPGRKIDPGEKFGWKLLHDNGVGRWVAPAARGDGAILRRGDNGEAVAALRAMLADYGYGVGLAAEYDVATEQTVAAFQRHFRPGLVDGIADASTIATLKTLLTGLGAGALKAGEV